jgi:hypothetical protein
MEDHDCIQERKNKRVPFNTEVEIQGAGIFQSVELSVGGMYIKATEPCVVVGDLLDIQFKLRKTNKSPIKVQGCVLYTHKRAGFGLGFLNLKPEDHQKIEKFIELVGE